MSSTYIYLILAVVVVVIGIFVYKYYYGSKDNFQPTPCGTQACGVVRENFANVGPMKVKVNTESRDAYGNFYSVPATYQSQISPRFNSGASYGSSIRYAPPSRAMQGVPQNPIYQTSNDVPTYQRVRASPNPVNTPQVHSADDEELSIMLPIAKSSSMYRTSARAGNKINCPYCSDAGCAECMGVENFRVGKRVARRRSRREGFKPMKRLVRSARRQSRREGFKLGRGISRRSSRRQSRREGFKLGRGISRRSSRRQSRREGFKLGRGISRRSSRRQSRREGFKLGRGISRRSSRRQSRREGFKLGRGISRRSSRRQSRREGFAMNAAAQGAHAWSTVSSPLPAMSYAKTVSNPQTGYASLSKSGSSPFTKDIKDREFGGRLSNYINDGALTSVNPSFSRAASRIPASQKTYVTSGLPVPNVNATAGLPIGGMSTAQVQPISYDRYMYANARSRLRSQGDPIRGDLPIIPYRSDLNNPSVNPNIDLNQGAMMSMGGFSNVTSRSLASLMDSSSGGSMSSFAGAPISQSSPGNFTGAYASPNESAYSTANRMSGVALTNGRNDVKVTAFI